MMGNDALSQFACSLMCFTSTASAAALQEDQALQAQPLPAGHAVLLPALWLASRQAAALLSPGEAQWPRSTDHTGTPAVLVAGHEGHVVPETLRHRDTETMSQ